MNVDRRRRGKQRRIGVLGGTFDPVHNGHLAIAEAALDAQSLDDVLIVPAARPWMREGAVEASAADRMAMVEAAVAGVPRTSVSRVDIDRKGPTYSLDTMSDLREEFGPDAELFLIVGADSMASLPRWKDVPGLLERCRLLVVGRPDGARPSDLPEGHPARDAKYVEGPMVDVSASGIRRRLAAGAQRSEIATMTPAAVVDYIFEHGLYGAVESGEPG